MIDLISMIRSINPNWILSRTRKGVNACLSGSISSFFSSNSEGQNEYKNALFMLYLC